MAKPTQRPGQQVAPVNKPGTLQAVPEFMRGRAGQGMEALSTADYEMPRVKLLQGISPEVEANDDLKSGMFYHTLGEQSLGTRFRMTPLFISKRYVLWRPRKPIDLGGILARADDGIHWSPSQGEFAVKVVKGSARQVTWRLAPTVAASGLAEWGTYDPEDPNSQPAATQVFAIVAALPDFLELSPVILLLQRKGIRPARKLMGKLKISGAPTYGCYYTVSSETEGDEGNKFQNWVFGADGFVQDPEEFAANEAMYEVFARDGVRIKDLEAAQDDEPEGEVRENNAEAAKKERRF